MKRNYDFCNAISSILVLILFGLCTNGPTPLMGATFEKQICQDLQRNVGPKLNVLMIGFTRKTLLLITKDYYVYEQPIETLKDRMFDQWFWNSTNLVKLSDKYPLLWYDDEFQQIKESVKISFILIHDDDEYLVFINENGVFCFDTGNNLILSGSISGYLYKAFVSTPISKKMYGIRRMHATLKIDEYSFRFINDSIILEETDQYRTMCWRSLDDHIEIDFDHYHELVLSKNLTNCEEASNGLQNVDWPLLKGFVFDHKFYMLGDLYVYSFDEDAFLHDNQPFPVRLITYRTFFHCNRSDDRSFLTFLAKDIATIAALVFIIIILIVLLLYCLCCCGKKRPNKQREEEPQKPQKADPPAGNTPTFEAKSFYNPVEPKSIKPTEQPHTVYTPTIRSD